MTGPAVAVDHPRRWARRGLFGLLLVAYVVLGSAYRQATPFGEGPDEPGHIAYMSFLREHGRPPRHGEVTGPLAQQVKHPPLYYALGVLATWGQDDRELVFVPNGQLSGNLDRSATFTAHRHSAAEQPPLAPRYAFVASLRRLSLWLGLVTVLAAFALAGTVLPGAWWLAFASAAVVAFLPQFLFMSGVANNDALATTAGSLALVAAARVVMRPPRRRDFVLLGLLLGVGLLAKLTTLALVLVGGLAVAGAARRARSWRLLGQGAVWSGGMFLIVAGSWLVWNAAVNGDLLGWAGFASAAGESARRTPLGPELPAYFKLQLESFLGRFGWMVLPLPELLYTAFRWSLVAAATGLGFLAWRVWRHPERGEGPLAERSSWWGLGLLVATVALVYASVFRLAFTFDLVVAQGRYLFPALAAFAVLFVVGLTGWLPTRWQGPAQAALAAGWFGLAVYAYAAVLAPTYAPVTSLRASAGRVDLQRADFGPGWVRLLAEPCPSLRRVTGAGPIDWPVTWQTGEQQPDAGLVQFTQLLDGAGTVLAQDDRVPLAGRYPSGSWMPGRVFTETVRLDLPAVDAPQLATVITGWYPDEHPEARVAVRPLTAMSAGCVGAVDAAEQAFAWPIVLEPAVPVTRPPGALAHADRFGQPATVQLDGLVVAPRPAEDGSPALAIDTIWRALGATGGDDTVFVHLSDAAGRLVATADRPPAQGRYPTRYWQLGELVPDQHELALRDVPDGRYRLTIGWYDPGSGRRRKAVGGQGQPWPDDEALLGTVVVRGGTARFEPAP